MLLWLPLAFGLTLRGRSPPACNCACCSVRAPEEGSPLRCGVPLQLHEAPAAYFAGCPLHQCTVDGSFVLADSPRGDEVDLERFCFHACEPSIKEAAGNSNTNWLNNGVLEKLDDKAAGGACEPLTDATVARTYENVTHSTSFADGTEEGASADAAAASGDPPCAGDAPPFGAGPCEGILKFAESRGGDCTTDVGNLPVFWAKDQAGKTLGKDLCCATCGAPTHQVVVHVPGSRDLPPVGNGLGNGLPPVLEGDAVLKETEKLPVPAQHSRPFAANRPFGVHCPGPEPCEETPDAAANKGGYACNHFPPADICHDSGALACTVSRSEYSALSCDAICGASKQKCLGASSDLAHPSCPDKAKPAPPPAPAANPAGSPEEAAVAKMTTDELRAEWAKVQDAVGKEEAYNRFLADYPGEPGLKAWKHNNPGVDPPGPPTPEEVKVAEEEPYLRGELAHRGAVNVDEAAQSSAKWGGKLVNGKTTACQTTHTKNSDGELQPVSWCECAVLTP